MDPQRWTKLRELYEAGIELAPHEREEFAAGRAGDDPDLLRELCAMFAAAEEESDFLETPGWDPLDAPRAAVGDHIGGYRLLRVLGEGGMSTVYEAEQDQPRRRVALKQMRAATADERAVQRFQLEAEILGRMHHPGIAQVYASGLQADAQGRRSPWIAMEHVPGAQPVTEYVAGARMDVRQRVELGLELCDALHHAHQRGVIHRDLKPSNVLVDEGGRARLIDFGIARLAAEGEEAALTRSGEVLGTLRYMAPEQLSGQPDDVDLRCDVYALGVLLYELLCGRGPYELEGASPVDTALAIQRQEPLDPVLARPGLRRELAWILLRCLEKEPARRYPSVSELANDLRRYLNEEPVAAGPPTASYRLRKFVRRHRGPLAAAALVFLALVAGLIGTTRGLREARRQGGLAKERGDELALEAGRLREVAELVRLSITSVDPIQESGGVTLARDLVDGLAERVRSEEQLDPRVELFVSSLLASTYHNLGRPLEARPFAERAAELSVDVHWGPGQPSAPELAELHAQVLQALGLLEPAQRAAERARALAARDDGAGTGLRDDIDLTLAEILREIGRVGEAEAIARDVAENWPEDAPEHRARRRRALIALEAVRTAEDPRRSEELLALAERDLPRSLHDLLTVLTMRGYALQQAGDLERARACFERAERLADEAFGIESPRAIEQRLAKAVLLYELGEQEAAERDMRAAQAALGATRGSHSSNTFLLLANLATLLTTTGRRDQAEQLLEDNIEQALDTLGAANRAAQVMLAALVYQRSYSNRYEEALDLVERALDAVEGQVRPDLTDAFSRNAERVAYVIGWTDDPRAFEALERCVEALRRSGQERTEPGIAARTFLVGLAPRNEGAVDDVELEARIEELLADLEELEGPEGSRALDFRFLLGRSEMGVGHLDAALEHLETALEGYMEHAPPTDHRTIWCANSLARCYERMGDPGSAIALRQDAMERIDPWLAGAGDNLAIVCADLLFDLGRTRLSAGETEAAEREFAAAIEMRGRTELQRDSPFIARYRLYHARAAIRNGGGREASAELRRAAARLAELLPEGHDWRVVAEEALGELPAEGND